VYRVRRAGHDVLEREFARLEAVDYIAGRLKTDGDVGDQWFLSAPEGSLAIRAIARGPQLVDAPSVGTPAIKELYVWTFSNFEEAESWGICNCRYIAGTHTWSQHAWCNGLDVHFDRMSDCDEYVRQLKHDNVSRQAAQILWRIPDHFDHAHLSGAPMRSGRPPCAG